MQNIVAKFEPHERITIFVYPSKISAQNLILLNYLLATKNFLRRW